jgi:hypothetical protein
LHKSWQSVLFVVLAAIAAASMWFYVIEILRAHQIVKAQAKQIPRGNLSDLYPRWLGTRELLMHHRNPYSREVALEIEEGYYGRRLEASRPNDPKDQQSFAYPVYVVFLLAPLIWFPFASVLSGFYWLLAILTAVSVWLWLRVLRWQLSPSVFVACALLTLGSFPAVQGIKLQQLSLLVAALVAGSAFFVARGRLLIGGVLLALATIKPQLAWPLVAWMCLWAVSSWRARRNFVVGFGATMAALLVGAEILLPGWLQMFAGAIGQYHRYTQNQPVLEVILNGVLPNPTGGVSDAPAHVGADVLAFFCVLACGLQLWRLRRQDASSYAFGAATSLVLALTVLVVPMYAPYNQVLLLPAILLLARDREKLRANSKALQFGYALGGLALAWQWIASMGLSAIYLVVSPSRALQGWSWPFFATFAVPVIFFVLTFFCVRQNAPPLALPAEV